MDGGVAALGLSSGQAASMFSILNVASAGDNFVCSTDIYGGSWNLFKNTMSNMGIEVRFVDPRDPSAFGEATDSKTRAYYAETLPNPKLQVFPIAEVSDIGRKLGVPLIVDNTAAPLICRPIDHGAAIVMYSTTKYIGGHGTSIGGLLIDGGNFDWEAHADRFPTLNKPDPSYHGAIWTEAAKPLGPIAYILKARVTLLRDIGAAMSPQNAFQFLQGVETLPLRMERHCENASKVASYLQSHSKVRSTVYPGLMHGVMKERADRYLINSYGALIGMELETTENGKRFIDSLELLYHVANIGDARSLAIHPASTTHSQLSDTELSQAGVTPGFVRLSIGIERVEDIIADIEQALSKI
jgi:O-acetylhomoserine (thiol)-lyase